MIEELTLEELAPFLPTWYLELKKKLRNEKVKSGNLLVKT